MDKTRCSVATLIWTALLTLAYSPPAIAKGEKIDELSGTEVGEEGASFSWTCEWSEDEEVTFTWDLGDGTTVTDTNSDGESEITHTFVDGDASFDVTCVAETTDGKHDDQESQKVTVTNADPVLTARGDETCVEDAACGLSFTLEDAGAHDTHTWTATLPDGATLDTSAMVLTWTPTYHQVGTTTATLLVTDDDGGTDELSWDFEVLLLDEDGDGLSDVWESAHGLDPTDGTDGATDPDGDGRTNADEFAGGTDPRHDDSPGSPAAWTPADGDEWQDQALTLVVENAESPVDAELWVAIELYGDETMSALVAASELLPQDHSGLTPWLPDAELTENTWYHWWAVAQDGFTTGAWSAPASFFYNTVNDPPTAPGVQAPLDGAAVDTPTPALVLDLATDPDGDPLTYTVVVRGSDGVVLAQATGLVADAAGVVWTLDVPLPEDAEACWQGWAIDDEGLEGAASELACFWVDLDNQPPSAPTITKPELGARVWRLDPEITINNGVDPEGRTTAHLFELDREPGFASPDLQTETVPSGDDGTTQWTPEALLLDDTTWYLRVRCTDGAADSEPTTVDFFVNSENDSPSTPALHNPADGADVLAGDEFSVVNSTDSDREELTYEFRVTSMASGVIVDEVQVMGDPSGFTGWTPDDAFDEGQYIWTVRAIDPKDLASDWATPRGFEAVREGTSEPTGTAEPLPFWGCSARGGSTGGAGLLLLALGLVGARRRPEDRSA